MKTYTITYKATITVSGYDIDDAIERADSYRKVSDFDSFDVDEWEEEDDEPSVDDYWE